MNYVDPELVQGFRIEVTQQLADAVEFAVNFQRARGEDAEDELRQAAQDALAELLPGIVVAAEDAYRKSALGQPDYEAIAMLFKQLAIRTRLSALSEGATVGLDTRKGATTGPFYGVVPYDGNECVHVGDEFVPVASIRELHA